MHGSLCQLAVSECDLHVQVPDLMTESGKLDEFASALKSSTLILIQLRWGKPYTRVPIVGDVRKVLIDLLRRCQEVGECVARTKHKSG